VKPGWALGSIIASAAMDRMLERRFHREQLPGFVVECLDVG
jgi:hypothetical protein